MVKNFKKIMACLLAFAVIFTCIGSALATVSADTTIITNANGKATDVGIWYTTYNSREYWAHRFADPNALPVGYDALLPDGSYGVPFSGNTDIIDFHIEQMAKAGIDFIMIDLTNGGLSSKVAMGWGETAGYKGSFITEYAKLTCERISKWNDEHAWKIRYAISVGTYDKLRGKVPTLDNPLDEEDFTVAQAAEWQAEGVKEMFVDNEVYGDDYYIFDGKPLITLFDWTELPADDEGVKEYSETVGTALNGFTVRSASVGQANTYGWYNKDGIVNVTEEVALVSPGHYNEGTSLSRDNGNTYKNAWKTVIESNITPRIVMISSFNDYMENTAVFVSKSDRVNEAAGEDAWQNPYQYWDMTIDYIEALRAKDGDSTVVDTGAENFALTATVTANYANFDEAGPLKCINDDNLGSRSLTRAMDNGDNEVKIEFDFGTAKTINNIDLYADSNQANLYGFRDLAVEVLTESGWVRVAEIHDLSALSNKQLVPVYFAPVKATKVAIIVDATGQANSNYASFAEIKIFNNKSVTEKDYTGIAKATHTDTVIDGQVSANYALAGVVTTNTSIRGNTAKNNNMWTLGNVNDGKLNNYYYGYVSGEANVNYSKNPYIQVDFDSAKAINNVNFYSCSSGQQKYYNDYAVDVKLADGSWKRVATRYYSVEGQIVSGNAQKVAFYFPTELAVAFRITCDVQNCQDVLNGGNAANKDLVFSCTEVQAFYNSAASANTYTGVVKPTDSVNIPGIKSENYALTATVSATTKNLEAKPLTNINNGKIANNRSLTYALMANDQAQITFEWQEAVTINNIDLYGDGEEWDKYAFRDLAIDVLLEDGTPIRVAELHDVQLTKNAQLVPVYFAPVTTTKVVITVDTTNQTENTSGKGLKTFASFAEIEAYFDSAVIPAQYTGIAKPTDGAVIAGIKSENYALTATVSATTNNLAEKPLKNINNGNHNTGDRSLTYALMADDQAQITFEWQEAVTINNIDLYGDGQEWDKYAFRDLAIDVLLEDGTCLRVAELHDVQLTKNAQLVPVYFAPVTTTKVVITVDTTNQTENTSGKGLKTFASFAEIEMYYTSKTGEYTGIQTATAGAEITGLRVGGAVAAGDFALGQKVTTSNTDFASYLGDYPAFRLTDGVYDTHKTTYDALSNYVGGLASFTVNYDKAYTINKVVLRLSAQQADLRPDEYVIDVLTEDGWVRVALQPDNNAVTMTFYFEAIECTAVRVIGNAKYNHELYHDNKDLRSPNFRINEIETYFDETVTEGMYTGTKSDLGAQYTAGVQGDVDGNTWVNAVDLAYALNWYTRARERVEGNKAIMDTNRDGKYDIRDYLYLVEEIAARDWTLMA